MEYLEKAQTLISSPSRPRLFMSQDLTDQAFALNNN
jgi:hypothetical protein